MSASTTVEDLPDDVVLLAFSFLSFKDVGKLAQVSHRFHRLSRDNQLWYARAAHASHAHVRSRGRTPCRYTLYVQQFGVPRNLDKLAQQCPMPLTAQD